MVGRIGPILRLNRQAFIERPLGALGAAGVIKLDARFGGGHRHRQPVRARQPQHIAQVLAAA